MRFAIVSLNVWALPWSLASDTPARMEAIGSRLPDLDADVFAFQEVWTAAARAPLVAAGRASGHAHVWQPESTWGNGGLLLLSRHPIRSARFSRFALGGLPQRLNHADYYAGKGVLRVELATPAGPLCVAVTHLHAGYGRHGPDDEYRGHRAAEAIDVAWALHEVTTPLVLAGDLNAYEDDPETRILRGLSGLTDTAVALDHRQETVLPFSPYRPNEKPPGPRIDYVLFRGGRARSLSPRSIERVLDEEFVLDGRPATYSDHAGLRAEFESEEQPGPPPGPSPRALALAEKLLAEGRERAYRRQAEQRALAGGAGAGALALLVAAPRVTASRRGVLRAGLYASAGLGLAGAGGWAALSEGFTPVELAGYQLAEQRLAAFARAAR